MSWEHPWLRLERATRAVIADRLTRGSCERSDVALATILSERQRLEKAGSFN
jgi:hypothetical protein